VASAIRPLKVLALETSTEHCSVALRLGGETLADARHAGQRHSELILPMAHGLLARAGIGLSALDGIAFGEGPGSFTGLRIACGIAQGLALGAGLPVVGIGTLLALAEASGAGQALCCLDARMREVYHAAYARETGGWRTVFAPGLYAPGAIPRPPGEGWVGCGSGFLAFGELLAERLGGTLATVRADLVPDAREIAALAAAELAAGRGLDPAAAHPLYVRDKVALTVEEQR